MSEQKVFGRRQEGFGPMRGDAFAHALSPEAEAFRAELRSSGGRVPSEFAEWRRSQRGGRVLAWGLTFLLLVPGGLAFVLNAPASASAGLEIAGVALSWWLRRQRRRHLAAITGWDGG